MDDLSVFPTDVEFLQWTSYASRIILHDFIDQRTSGELSSSLSSSVPPPRVMRLPRYGGDNHQIMTFESPDSCLKTSYLRVDPP